MSDFKTRLDALAIQVAAQGGSDLHLSVGRHPTLRISGELAPLAQEAVLMPQDTEGMILSILTEDQKARLPRAR